MRAFKVMPKALRILAKKLTHLACNSRQRVALPIFFEKTGNATFNQRGYRDANQNAAAAALTRFPRRSAAVFLASSRISSFSCTACDPIASSQAAMTVS